MLDALRELASHVFGGLGAMYYALPVVATQKRRTEDQSVVQKMIVAFGVQVVVATIAVVGGSVLAVKLLEKDIEHATKERAKLELRLDLEIVERKREDRRFMDLYIEGLKKQRKDRK